MHIPQPLLTAGGEEHGLVNVMPNSCKTENTEHMKPEVKAEYEKKRKEDRKMVRARYINYRGPNERLDKVYMKYPPDPLMKFHLIPNHVYDLPLGFVNEVNSHQGMNKRGERLEDGKYIGKDGVPDRIHELVPCNFT